MTCVCLVSDQSFPALGGEGQSTETLARKLLERGHNVVALTSRVKRPRIPQGIRLYRFGGIPLGKGRGVWAVATGRRIRELARREGVELVHVSQPSFLGRQAARVAKRMGLPVVMSFHVQEENLTHHLGLGRRAAAKALGGWFRGAFRYADRMIAPSRFAADLLRGYYDGPIEVISNGVDRKRFSPERVSEPARRSFRERLRIGRRPLLLYVGRLWPDKNPRFLVEIARSLRSRGEEFFLAIVGSGPEKPALERMIARAGLRDEVRLLGYLESDDFFAAYACADIFILPSPAELQGIVLLEAMAMETALLVADVPTSAAMELVKPGSNGYGFSLEDPDDAAEKAQRILRTPGLLARMKAAGRRIVRTHDLELSIDRIESLYRELGKERGLDSSEGGKPQGHRHVEKQPRMQYF